MYTLNEIIAKWLNLNCKSYKSPYIDGDMAEHESNSAGLDKNLLMHLRRPVLRFYDWCLRYFDEVQLVDRQRKKKQKQEKHIHEIPIVVNVV